MNVSDARRRSRLLNSSILEALAYSDIFDYPLGVEEIWAYASISCSRADVADALNSAPGVEQTGSYYHLRGRREIVAIRIRREAFSTKALARALAYGRILAHLPFIRMVALTGSLAVGNSETGADYDYMLVTKKRRLWLARAFVLLWNRIANLFGETICPNLIISENQLAWHDQSLYAAREICQMRPVAGLQIYEDFRTANSWVYGYFPNQAGMRNSSQIPPLSKNLLFLRNFLEFLLENPLGDALEAWEMKRKSARLCSQAGHGPETSFSEEICQGNFNHHGLLTMQRYRQRLSALQAHESILAEA